MGQNGEVSLADDHLDGMKSISRLIDQLNSDPAHAGSNSFVPSAED